jgi:two-component system LytT family response regulator
MKNRHSCIIVDDEPKAIELLADSIQDLYDNIDIMGTYTTWKTALPAIRNNDFDILFLDISMPQKTGIDILELVPELKSEVIFVTAHSEYALNAFKYFAAGYILKPVKDTVLTKTIDKALERISYKKLVAQKKLEQHNAKNRIAIPNNNGLDYFNLTDILYFEATSRYTKATTSTSEILSSYSIGKFKEILDGNTQFYQVHRSFIVNLDFVKRYERNGTIIMSDGYEIPVAKNTREDFLNIFDKASKSHN